MKNPTIYISKRYFLIPVILGPFFILFYLVYTDIKNRTVEEFNKEQLVLAQTASKGISSFFDEYKSDLRFFASIGDIIDFSENGKSLIADFYESHKNFIGAFTRVDSRGIILYTYPYNQALIGEDISYQKHVREVIATHQPVISDVFTSVQGFTAIALHVPVFKGKEYKGSLAILIPIDKLGKRYLQGITIRGTGSVWLLSENGIEIYCPIKGHTGKWFLDITRNDPTAVGFMAKIRKESSGMARSIHREEVIDGLPGFALKYMVFSRTALGNTYWTIIISYHEEDIYLALSKLRNRLILIFSLLMVIVLYYFYSLSKVRTVLKEETRRKKAEKELILAKEKAEESDRLKSAFLANMSHEIRTPMNGILGFSELLKEPGLTGEEQQQYISIIERSGRRMLNIINDLMDISKIEAGQVEVSLSVTNLKEQAEFLYVFFKPEAEKKGIKLTLYQNLPLKEAVIETDREKVYAVLTNLIKNAIKYSHSGSIDFGYSLTGAGEQQFLKFYVRDTGIGIPLDRQEAIFERFVQADIEDRNAMQGAGLGLSISKAYVEMLGGKIWIESEEGRGATFFFTLPYKPAVLHETSMVQPVKPFDPGVSGYQDHAKLKILVVDDDYNSDFIITHAVRRFSREILHARSGIEAVECFRQHPDTDLILMDIKMPEMDGYEATREIRKFNKPVIIIAQTAFALVGDREKAIGAGCNDYITKPVNVNNLVSMVRSYFRMLS